MNLIEVSEREVLAKAKAWLIEAGTRAISVALTDAEVDLYNAVSLLVSREADAAVVERSVPCHAKTWPDGGEPFATQSICAKCGGDLDSPMSPRGDIYPPESLVFSEEPIVKPARGMRTENVADVAAGTVPDDLPMPPGGFMPEGRVSVPPRPGADPITRPPRKLSRREQEIERRRASDPMGRDRDDIDYSSDELPSVR